jgi:hypothetical protein
MKVISSDLYDPLVSRAQRATEALGKVAEAAAGRLGGAAANAVMSAVADNATSYLNAAKNAAKVSSKGGAALSKKEHFGELLGGEKAETRRRQALARARQLVAFNNLEASATCTLRLREEVLSEVRGCFESGPQLWQLEACVDELSGTAARCAAAKEEALGTLASHLRPRLRSVVAELLGDAGKGGSGMSSSGDGGEYDGGFAGFRLSDADYEEASDGASARFDWTGRLLSHLESLLEPFLGRCFLRAGGDGPSATAAAAAAATESTIGGIPVLSAGNTRTLLACIAESTAAGQMVRCTRAGSVARQRLLRTPHAVRPAPEPGLAPGRARVLGHLHQRYGLATDGG